MEILLIQQKESWFLTLLTTIKRLNGMGKGENYA